MWTEFNIGTRLEFDYFSFSFSFSSWHRQVTRIERPKGRVKEVDLPVRDEIEVVPLLDVAHLVDVATPAPPPPPSTSSVRGLDAVVAAAAAGRPSTNRRSLRPRPDKLYAEHLSDSEVSTSSSSFDPFFF